MELTSREKILKVINGKILDHVLISPDTFNRMVLKIVIIF